MKLAPCIERAKLKAPSFKIVEKAANLEAVLKQPPPVDAVYLMPLSERTDGRGNTAVGATIQEVTEVFGAMIVSRHAGGRKGGEAAEGLDELKDELNAAFVGWTHPEGRGPTLYLGGALRGFEGSAAFWLSTFSVKTQIRILGGS